MKLEDVRKLADLARIDIDDSEMEEIAHDFDTILTYISQVEEAASVGSIKGEIAKTPENYPLFNVTREDVPTNTSNEFTDKILANAPDIQDGFLKVKQIM